MSTCISRVTPRLLAFLRGLHGFYWRWTHNRSNLNWWAVARDRMTNWRIHHGIFIEIFTEVSLWLLFKRRFPLEVCIWCTLGRSLNFINTIVQLTNFFLCLLLFSALKAHRLVNLDHSSSRHNITIIHIIWLVQITPRPLRALPAIAILFAPSWSTHSSLFHFWRLFFLP